MHFSIFRVWPIYEIRFYVYSSNNIWTLTSDLCSMSCTKIYVFSVACTTVSGQWNNKMYLYCLVCQSGLWVLVFVFNAILSATSLRSPLYSPFFWRHVKLVLFVETRNGNIKASILDWSTAWLLACNANWVDRVVFNNQAYTVLCRVELSFIVLAITKFSVLGNIVGK